jgi:4-aminobutyrate aminotransferase/(S)-3-amino-2-methylpropionate transaminase
LIEPVLGRGGVVPAFPGFLGTLQKLTQAAGALLIADEIWTGLGRAGSWLSALENAVVPDLICLGKGLGGGLPVSAVIGSEIAMLSWRREPEVVHTSTFASAPLAANTAIATLEALAKEKLPERAASLGASYLEALKLAFSRSPRVRAVRGAGLMLGIDLGDAAGAASQLMRRLLGQGYIVSTGGGQREVLVLTPPLNIDEGVLMDSVDVIATQLEKLD